MDQLWNLSCYDSVHQDNEYSHKAHAGHIGLLAIRVANLSHCCGGGIQHHVVA